MLEFPSKTPVPVAEIGLRHTSDAVQALAAAFADYAMLRALCPDARRRAWVVPAFARMLYRISARAGGAFATDGFGAVACGLPPGSEWPSEWDYVRAGALSVVWRTGARAGWRFLKLGPAFDAARAKHMGDRPHWYLHLLGVRPDAQGKGLSRAVLRPMFDAADRDRAPIFLETATETNVAIYKRMGFAQLGFTELPGGIPNWEMAREPR